MGDPYEKIKRYHCLTEEEQQAYEGLNIKQRKYVDLRGQGYSKSDSYKMAGYVSRLAGQAGYQLERDNPTVALLIEKLSRNFKAKQITDGDSALNKRIDALAKQGYAENMLNVIDEADGETARRIQFYRDIMNGKIKTVKRTTKRDAQNKVLEVKIEETSDVESRMKARRELDRILGLTSMPSIDNFQIGGITVNIVDASKRDELDDTRNKVELDEGSVEVIDGERVVVVEDETTGGTGEQQNDETRA